MSLKIGDHGQTSFLLYGAISGIAPGKHQESKTKQKFRQIYEALNGRFCVLEIAYYDETEMVIWKWSHNDRSQLNTNTSGMFDRLNGFAPKYVDALKQWNEIWTMIASLEQEDWTTELNKLRLPINVKTVAKNAPVTSEGVLAALGEVKMTMARLKWYDQAATPNRGAQWETWRRAG